MGLIRNSCGHISGHHEPIHVKFGVSGFFIMFYWNMVMKMLKCKKRKFDDITLQYSLQYFCNDGHGMLFDFFFFFFLLVLVMKHGEYLVERCSCSTDRLPFRPIRLINGPVFYLINWFRYRSRFCEMLTFRWFLSGGVSRKYLENEKHVGLSVR